MERPRIPILPTIADFFLEIMGIVFISATLVYIGMHYKDLPEIIPTHFNFQGEVDGFGSKFTLWLLPLIGIVMFIGLSILCKYPYIFNYPVEVTRRNVIRQYRMAIRLIRWIKTETALLFGFIVVETIEVAKGQPVASPFMVLSFLGVIMLTVVIYLIKASKAG